MNLRLLLSLTSLIALAPCVSSAAPKKPAQAGAAATVRLTVGALNPDPACWGCHEKGIAPQLAKPVLHLPFKGASDCGACHRPHGKDEKPQLTEPQPDLCLRCHAGARFRQKNVHSIIEGDGCTACHAPHSGDQPRLLKEPPEALCEGCHPGVEHKEIRIESRQCLACHDPHSSSRAKLVKPVVHEVLITLFVITTAPITAMLLMRAAVQRPKDGRPQ